MALSRPLLYGLIAAVIVLPLLFVPLTWFGVQDYNVRVAPTVSETCVLFSCSYEVQSIAHCVSGGASAIDLPGWLGWGGCTPKGSIGSGAPNLGTCAVKCTYEVKTTISGPSTFSASASESKFVGNVLTLNVDDTLTFSFAYVPAGHYSVTTDLYVNGATVATGSGGFTVP